MTAYGRDANGSLVRCDLILMDDGEISLGSNYNPVTLTPDGTTTLKGWGRDDGEAAVYRTESGREVIVPERHRERVAAAVTALS